MSSTAQVTANQANSKQSTGPQTSTGKARASHNALRHGLAGVLIIAGEKPEEFEALLADLSEEFQPATTTEALLVKDMAIQSWLKTRAIRFQAIGFKLNIDLDRKSVLPCDMDVLLRYHNAFHRAFHKSLQVLRDLQKERRKSEIGFVSQESKSTEKSTAQPVDPVQPVGQTIASCRLSTPDSPKTSSPAVTTSQKTPPE